MSPDREHSHPEGGEERRRTESGAGQRLDFESVLNEVERRASSVLRKPRTREMGDADDLQRLRERSEAIEHLLGDMKTCLVLHREVLRLDRVFSDLIKGLPLDGGPELLGGDAAHALESLQDTNEAFLRWMNPLDVEDQAEEAQQLVQMQIETLRTTERLLRMMIVKSEKLVGGSENP